jgi:hypothetical protein
VILDSTLLVQGTTLHLIVLIVQLVNFVPLLRMVVVKIVILAISVLEPLLLPIQQAQSVTLAFIVQLEPPHNYNVRWVRITTSARKGNASLVLLGSTVQTCKWKLAWSVLQEVTVLKAPSRLLIVQLALIAVLSTCKDKTNVRSVHRESFVCPMHRPLVVCAKLDFTVM